MDIYKIVGARRIRPNRHYWSTPCQHDGCKSYSLSGTRHCRMHALPSERPVEGLRTALDRELGIKARNALKRLSEQRRTIEATRRQMARELTDQILTHGPTTQQETDTNGY